jgi:hypothetical protein
LGSALLEESSAATLVWLVTAKEHARSTGQTKVVGYLEEVAWVWVWVCPASTDCLPLSHSTSSHSNLLVLSGAQMP